MFVETPQGGRFRVQTDTDVDGNPRAFCSLGGSNLYASSVEKLGESAKQLFGAQLKEGDAYAVNDDDDDWNERH